MAKKKVPQAGAIVVYGDTVVLRRNKAAKWIFPKGHVEPGETAAETAVREVEEETGLVVEVVEPVGSATFKRDGRTLDVEYFVARAVRASNTWGRHHNVDTFLVPPDQVAARLSFGNLRELWEQARERVVALAAGGT